MRNLADSTRCIPASPRRWRWHDLLVAHLAMDAVGILLARLAVALFKQGGVSGKEIRAYYRKQVRPKFSPPGWVFLPAWTINRLITSAGLLRALNTPKGTP